MLIWALDDEGHLVHITLGDRCRDYRCPECLGLVRVRKGENQAAHFYHYAGSYCHLNQVGAEHRACQGWLLHQFESRGKQEVWFRSIQRIADLSIPHLGLILEIQYSPIRPEEVIQRTRDYQELGLEVIWILDFDRFIQGAWSEGEPLSHCPHYYMKMSELTYAPLDRSNQLIDCLGDEYRVFSIGGIWRSGQFSSSPDIGWSPASRHLLWQRNRRWPIGFLGDWLSCPTSTPIA